MRATVRRCADGHTTGWPIVVFHSRSALEEAHASVLLDTALRDCWAASEHVGRKLICRAIQARISCADPAPAAEGCAAMQACMAAMQAAVIGHAATSGGEA
jgi:hypothetical protein